MKKTIILAILGLFAISVVWGAGACMSCELSSLDAEVMTDYFERNDSHIVSRANRAHQLNDDYYITYSWDSRPRIGHHVLIVKLYNNDRELVQDLDITADAYMPSMKGAHDTGDVPMRLNRNGEYVVPVHFMMRGDWEFELKFSDDGKEITRAYIQHNL